jgi:hypothetical protein
MEIKKNYNNNIHYKLIEELGQKLPTFPVHLISAPGFSDNKGIIRNRKSKHRQYNGQKTKEKKDKQYNGQQTKDGRTDSTTAKRQRTEGQTIQRPTDKGRKDRKYNGQKTKDGRTNNMIYGILRCIFCPQIPRDDYLCYDDINKC